MTPFQSGLTTFAGAAGALTVGKVSRQRAFETIGFRTALLSASVAGAAMTAVNGLFTEATHRWS